MKRFLLLVPLLAVPALAQKPSPYTRSGLAPAFYPVGSRIEDKQALGGFAESKNFSRPIGKVKAPANQVSLVLGDVTVDEKQKTSWRTVFVVNRTARLATLAAEDSSLFMVQEARNTKGQWKPVEEQLNSFCGNSYHRVFLEPNRMWVLKAPIYEGKFSTQFRFVLSYGKSSLQSPPFGGRISLGQFDPQKVARENPTPTPTEIPILRPDNSPTTAPKVIRVPRATR